MDINISITSHLVKPIKYYINKKYRKKVFPVEGSIIYSDFGNSGIYVGNNEIVSINVDNLLNEISEVKKITLEEFLENANFSENIYVSSNENGAVGNKKVCEYAKKQIGEKNSFGLIYENNYSFSKKCLDFSEEYFFDNGEDLEEKVISEIGLLKQKGKNKIGATKWFLLNKGSDLEENKEFNKELLDVNNNYEKIEEIIKQYEEVPLNDDIMSHLQKELAEIWDFFREILNEKLPDFIMKNIIKIIKALEEIIFLYEKNENTIKGLGGDFSYQQLKEMGDEFRHLVDEMLRNKKIQDVLKKLGKGKLEKSSELENKVLKVNRNEVFGINKSNDISRMLSSELLNLEDENLKYLFYSKYLENNLLTYEIKGENDLEEEKNKDKVSKKGPIVICLDTSGSMKGSPIQRAKALVLAIIKILKKEERDLHIIIFGAKDQYQEIVIEGENEIFEALKFLRKSYEGGTDFETPLKRGIEIIKNREKYEKADILMVTDGACKISFTFKKIIKEEKKQLNFKIYTIICEADRIEKDFSDSVIVI